MVFFLVFITYQPVGLFSQSHNTITPGAESPLLSAHSDQDLGPIKSPCPLLSDTHAVIGRPGSAHRPHIMGLTHYYRTCGIKSPAKIIGRMSRFLTLTSENTHAINESLPILWDANIECPIKWLIHADHKTNQTVGIITTSESNFHAKCFNHKGLYDF